MKHCIVTPDIIGPVKNGGIGTACYHLAKFLKEQGDHVTILYTGPIENKNLDFWITKYINESIELRHIDPQEYPEKPINNGYWFIERSIRVHMWLSDRAFNQIHFQEWQANGFIAIQAKRTGQAYADTLITTTVHSCEEWIIEGNMRLPVGGVEYILRKHCEKYSAEHADITINPSHYMQKWCEGKGWKCTNKRVVPYLFESNYLTNNSTKNKRINELCFFGRLETRKGLEIFLKALEIIKDKEIINDFPIITFLGKNTLIKSRYSDDIIKEFSFKFGVETNIFSDLDSEEALKYLDSEGRCAIIPTLQDNLPYAVIECVERKIPLIASRIGGVPEIIGSDEHLFDPNARSLAEKITNVLHNGIKQPIKTYSSDKARKGWNVIRDLRRKSNACNQWNSSDVTICIAYYNYGKYLPSLLGSLEKQSANGFSIIVVNDGSSEDFSNEVFDNLKNKYSDNNNWAFLKKKNGGIGETRNFAASYAKTDLIVFMDADNEAEPFMIEKMILGMNASGVDCLTCHMSGFSEDDEGGKKIVYSYAPTGGPIEAGIFTNCLGDANFIIKKEVFQKMGGFNTDRTTSYEDWEFLLHLLLEGYSLDAIPEKLFLYRHTDAGFSRNTSISLNHLRVINRLENYFPSHIFSLIKDLYTVINTHSNGFIEKVNQGSMGSELVYKDIFERMFKVLSGDFNEVNYIRNNYRSLNSPGIFDWIRFPRLHYILFNHRN